MFNLFRPGEAPDAFPISRPLSIAETARNALTAQATAVSERITELEERAARIAEELAELRVLSSALAQAHETIHIAPMDAAIEEALND